jgi:hypothetical protein
MMDQMPKTKATHPPPKKKRRRKNPKERSKSILSMNRMHNWIGQDTKWYFLETATLYQREDSGERREGLKKIA